MLKVHRVHIFFFFFNDTATTEIYTLSLHDALPISSLSPSLRLRLLQLTRPARGSGLPQDRTDNRERSEEHTSELQSQSNLVCRLLLEKKKQPHPRPPLTTSAADDHVIDRPLLRQPA